VCDCGCSCDSGSVAEAVALGVDNWKERYLTDRLCCVAKTLKGFYPPRDCDALKPLIQTGNLSRTFVATSKQ
jgi:hypothetical protein